MREMRENNNSQHTHTTLLDQNLVIPTLLFSSQKTQEKKLTIMVSQRIKSSKIGTHLSLEMR
jgi:hypothetical protein